MRNNLPPLRALRDFEVVARHKSVSAAARSLLVTPAAVSRQITLLESRLGCRLFTRHHRGLELTEKGRVYLEEVREAFNRIEAATGALVSSQQNAVLSVRVYTTLAMEWLIPRLQTFRERHPEIEISLVASLNRIDFDTDIADVALLPMTGPNSSLRQDLLFKPQFTPVCSPRLIERGTPLRHPRDLQSSTLLYSHRLSAHWQVWLERAGVSGPQAEHGLWFESSSQAYQAAREGAGIALGQPLFLLKDLMEGRLIVPFQIAVESSWSYWITSLLRRADEPHIAAFREWLIEERDSTTTDAAALLLRKLSTSGMQARSAASMH